MIILGIDPGTKPGAVVLDGATGALLRASHSLAHLDQWRRDIIGGDTPWPVVATEGQWYYGGPDAPDVNDLLKLAFRAGWQLRGVPAERHLRISPQVWRGNSSANKVQMQKRIARELTVADRKLFANIPVGRHGDVLDAIGIARAAARLAPSTREYDYE